MEEARRMITKQYVEGKISKEEYEDKLKFVDEVSKESTPTSEKSKTEEVSFQSCILWGFFICIFLFLIVVIYLMSLGVYLEGASPMQAIVLALGAILFLTFIIFAPVIYVIRKVIIPKLKELLI